MIEPTGRVLLLVALGVLAWAAIWFTTPVPRAGYDTLWYTRFAHQYAGASREEAIERSWLTFQRYGDPERVTYVADRNGWPWDGEFDPSRRRWVGIYQMRPAMPLVTAAGVPWLGTDAPLLASVLAVIAVVAITGLLLMPVTGTIAGVAFLGLTLVNPGVSGWLVHLTPDGLGIALWLGVLAVASRFIVDGRRGWLAAFIAISILLAFTRQIAAVLPLTFALAAAIALARRAHVGRRLGVLAIASVPALILFSIWTTVAGLPSLSDVLQDAPTTHFSRPDVPDPIAYLARTNAAHLPMMLGTLLSTPLLVVSAVLALVGFVVRPRWWALPFVCAIATIPLLYAVHPISTEAPRTLAPMWLSVHLGIGLLLAAIIGRKRPIPRSR